MAKKTAAFFEILLLTIVLVYPYSAAGAVRINPEELLGTIIREVLKDDQSSTPPQQTGGTPGDAVGTLRASDLIKVEVIRDGVAMRDQPSANGEVIVTGIVDEFKYEFDRTVLYVDPTPVISNGDSWYKAHFFDYSGFGFFFQVLQPKYPHNHDNRWFYDKVKDVDFLYVNTKDVRQVPLEAHNKDVLAWFDQGRPPRFNFGDSMEKVKEFSTGFGSKQRSSNTIRPLRLYNEPNKESTSFILPAGSSIIDYMHYGDVNFIPLGMYIDMQDQTWLATVDTKSLKVIGWLSSDDRDQGFSDGPSDKDLGENYFEVFIY